MGPGGLWREAWNEANPRARVDRGDVIVAVNDVFAPAPELMQAIHDGVGNVRITFAKDR